MIKNTMLIFSQIETIFNFSSFNFDGDILRVSKRGIFLLQSSGSHLGHAGSDDQAARKLPTSSPREDEGMWMMIINQNIPNSVSKRG
jgi:hypothetical protein